MPKSTGPLSEQLGLNSQSTSANTMTDNTTAAADKLGANKSTNAIPQEVCLQFTSHSFLFLATTNLTIFQHNHTIDTASPPTPSLPASLSTIPLTLSSTEPLDNLLGRRNR